MKHLEIDPADFIVETRRLNDIELGALMRALVFSAVDDGKPKNILESSYFGVKTNGFFQIKPEDTISANECSFASLVRSED